MFAQFDEQFSTDPYNSEKYQQARLWFGDREGYRLRWNGTRFEQDPHCVKCEWQKATPNTDVPHIRQFLQAAAGDVFHPGSIRLFSCW